MPLLETPPDAVRDTLKSHNAAEGYDPEPRLSLAADMTPQGQYGERWFIVDQTRLRVVTPSADGPALVELDLPLSDIKEAKAETLVGGGALRLVLQDGTVREAVRYTLSPAPAFQSASRVLAAWLKGEEPSDSLLADFDKKKACAKCGDPLPDDTNVCPKCVDRKAVLLRLLSYAWPYKLRVFTITALMLAGTAMSLLPMIFQQHLVDDVLIPHHHRSWIGWILAGLIGVGILGKGVEIWRGRLVSWMSNHMVYTIRVQAYDRLQSLSLGYYDKRQTGSLMARVTQDVGELQDFLVQGITFFLVNTLVIIGALAVLLTHNWRLTLLVLIPVPFTVFATKFLWAAMRLRFQRLWHLRGNLSASINSAISGVRVVKAFAQEAREAQSFQNKSHELFSASVVVGQAWNTYFPILSFFTTVGIFIVWYYGGLQVYANHTNMLRYGMTLGTLTLFIGLIGQLMGPLQQMTQIADWLSRSTASAERVFEIIDAEADVADAPDAVALPHIEGRVEMKNVRFSYDKNASILEDVSVDVAPGEMIGLVGHSGAGKSTIINLLSRFYDVKDGQILIDGVDIRKIKMEDLRRQIGVVLQEPFLFPGTIASNIAYAKRDATPEEIMQAAKAANAHDFVMRFPDGYDTYVGERGARLSGGERQRLSIARAILHDPRILILDEATASVDTETEKQIQEAMARLVEGRTTFAIAHRLSTLRNASRLMVMEKGKLVELGTHDELLSKPEGVFRRLVETQQEVNKLKDNFVQE
jgi:ATP-binding cassette subfamily B protein